MTSMVRNIDTKAHWESCVRTVHYDAGQFLGAQINQERYQQAQEIGQIDSRYRPVILNYTDNSRRSIWDWSTTTVTAPPQPAKTSEKEKTQAQQEKERAQRAKIIGVFFAGVGGLFTGHFYATYSRQTETLQGTVRAQKNISLAKEILGNIPLKSALYELIETQLKIDKLNISKSKAYFWSAASVLVSGGVLAWGGFSAAQRLITLGQAGLCASVVFTFYNIGAHLDDHKELRKYYIAILGDSTNRVKGRADCALEELSKVDENLRILADDAPPPYEPLYPDHYDASWAQPSPPPYQE